VLRHRPDVLRGEKLQRIKGPLVEFLLLTEEERATHLLELLKAENNTLLKLGVGQFEAILEPLGLVVTGPPVAKRLLLQMQQTRHVLLHKGGVADEKFCKRCPWLNLKPGDRITVTERQYNASFVASMWYALALDSFSPTCVTKELLQEYRETLDRQPHPGSGADQ
jgi:hypothetical protein